MCMKYITEQANDSQHYTFDIHTVNNSYILIAFTKLHSVFQRGNVNIALKLVNPRTQF